VCKLYSLIKYTSKQIINKYSVKGTPTATGMHSRAPNSRMCNAFRKALNSNYNVQVLSFQNGQQLQCATYLLSMGPSTAIAMWKNSALKEAHNSNCNVQVLCF